MAETAAVKAAKTAPAPAAPVAASAAVTPIRAQKLRDAQTRKFVESALRRDGEGDYERLTVGSVYPNWSLPVDWTFADCLNPAAWSNLAGKIAANPATGQRARIGSTIALHHPKFYADLLIKDVVRDHLGGPCGLKLICLGPAQDKDGRAAPRDLETGLPWSDPAIEEEAK